MHSLPYINGIFERVSSHLKNYLIDCVPKSNNNLSYVIVKGKDRIKNHLKNNAVYKIDLACDSSYVGQTKRYFKKRKSEHKNHKKSAIL